MRKLMIAATAALAFGTAGCSSLLKNSFSEPVVSFRGLSVQSLGLTGGSLEVQLGVYNPNGYDLNATRLTYNLLLDEIQFGSGELNEQLTVQKNDTTVVRVPIDFTYRGVGEAGRQLLNTGTVNYRVTGDVTVGTPLGNFTRPFDQSGRYTALRGSSSR